MSYSLVIELLGFISIVPRVHQDYSEVWAVWPTGIMFDPQAIYLNYTNARPTAHAQITRMDVKA